MGSNEWYTPKWCIDAARQVLGGIDLDPASCEMANRIVQATRYYTEAEDGLLQPWYGRVWLNAPFGRLADGSSRLKLFLERLIAEYECGKVTEAITLVKADPKQHWFFLLWEYPICFAVDRVYFLRPDGPPQKHQFGTAFVYLGPDEPRFIEVFSRFGATVKCVRRPEIFGQGDFWKELGEGAKEVQHATTI